MAEKKDYVGFTYNGKHSSDLNILRVSSSNRYSENIAPTFADTTADNPGADGTFYFGTFHRLRQFNVSIAFDSLTEANLRAVRQWLDGKNVHDLVFDEAPNKTYSAKVTSTPTLKYIPFLDENGGRIYKGEGTIQFTCYFPYARGSKIELTSASTQAERTIQGDSPASFVLKCTGLITKTVVLKMKDGTEHTLTLDTAPTASDTITWDSKTGLVSKTTGNTTVLVGFMGNSVLSLMPGTIVELTSGYSLIYTPLYY